MTDFGMVTKWETNTRLRPATPAEWRKTADAVITGNNGAWKDADGTVVCVVRGPYTDILEDDIRALRAEAAEAGDLEMVAICNSALGEQPDHVAYAVLGAGEQKIGTLGTAGALVECARVILDNRMGAAKGASGAAGEG